MSSSTEKAGKGGLDGVGNEQWWTMGLEAK